MSFEGKISGSLAPQGAKVGNLSGNIGAVVPDIRDESVTTAKLADAAVTIAKLAADVTALINSKGDASDVATLQSDVEALQTITAGLGTASTYGVANNLTQSASGVNVLDAAQGKVLGDRVTTAEGEIDTLNDGYTQLSSDACGMRYATNSSDGRYYSFPKFSVDTSFSARVAVLVGLSHQSYASNLALELVMIRSDGTITTSNSRITCANGVITVDNNSSAWSYPFIVYPKGYVTWG